MRQQNNCRIINEDIAALRNIAWAAMQRSDDYLDEEVASFTFDIANLLLVPNDGTGKLIRSLLIGESLLVRS